MKRLSKRQRVLIGMFVLGEIGEVEFFELALEAGMSLSAIETMLRHVKEAA